MTSRSPDIACVVNRVRGTRVPFPRPGLAGDVEPLRLRQGQPALVLVDRHVVEPPARVGHNLGTRTVHSHHSSRSS